MTNKTEKKTQRLAVVDNHGSDVNWFKKMCSQINPSQLKFKCPRMQHTNMLPKQSDSWTI